MRNTNGHKSLKGRVLAAALCTMVASASAAHAAYVKGTSGDDLLFGRDDDTQANAQIQPAGVVADQSLDKSDVIEGGAGDDVLVGLGGSDVLLGGPGNDILVGGTEQGQTPNSDTMIGGDGNDIALWRGGDGSEAFIGGKGNADALVFGNIDRDANNIPVISPTTGRHAKTGIPTADVTNQGGFCELERVQDPDFGYQFLIRFFVRATGNLAVTVRTLDVEQVYCTSAAGGQITFADLTATDPQFEVVSLDDVKRINPQVGKIIR
jgi:Ca2+-binding RTX toxin-like protein